MGNEVYLREEERFWQSEEGKTLFAPYNELMQHFSNHIEEPVDISRMGYLASGIERLVRDT